MHKKTNEEFAVIVKEHMKKYQDTTRNKIKIATGISNYKLNELEDLGLVNLPPKLKAGMNTPWRNYRT